MRNMRLAAAIAAMCALCLTVGTIGIAVGAQTYCAMAEMEKSIERLEIENAEIRDLIPSEESCAQRRELTLVVKSERTDKVRTKDSLAVQNRNYMNIKTLSNGDKWEGQIGVDKFGHVIFRDAAYGVRAGALTLISYEKRHGVDTVCKLVKRFSESNHDSYISYLCKRLKVKKDEKISLSARLPELLQAMIAFESGVVIGDEYIELISAVR